MAFKSQAPIMFPVHDVMHLNEPVLATPFES